MAISTKRKLSQLMTMLGDNAVGGISEEDLRDAIKSVYGNKSVTNVSYTRTLNVDDVFVYVSSTLTPIDLNLPSVVGSDGQDSTFVQKEFIISNRSTNNVIIKQHTGERIDGSTSNVIVPPGHIFSIVGVDGNVGWAVLHNSNVTDLVVSVNNKLGAVVLDADDISDESTTNKFVTISDVVKLNNITLTQPVNLDSMESSITGNANSITTIESDITGIDNSITTIESDITGIDNSITTIQSDITGIDNSITTIQSDITGNSNSITTIEGDITGINNSITTIQSDITGINNSITTIQSDITGIGGDITGIESDVLANTNHRTTTTGNPHSVTKSNVGLGNVLNIDTTNASNITTGTLPSSVLPPVAITSVHVVNSEVAMLALTTEEGDVVVRTDENKTYIRNSGTAGNMSDYTEMQTPTDSVLSVNNQTGTVILDADDINDSATAHKFVSQTDVNKLGNISVTQPVNLDSMESSITGNTNSIAGINNSITTIESDITGIDNSIATIESDITGIENDLINNSTGKNVYFVDTIDEFKTAISANTGDINESKTIYINKAIYTYSAHTFELYSKYTFVFGAELVCSEKLTFKKLSDTSIEHDIYMYNKYLSSDGLEVNSYDGFYDLEGTHLWIVDYVWRFPYAAAYPHQGLSSTIRWCRSHNLPLTFGYHTITLSDNWTGVHPEETWSGNNVAYGGYFVPSDIDDTNYRYEFRDGTCTMTLLEDSVVDSKQKWVSINAYYIGSATWTLIDSTKKATIIYTGSDGDDFEKKYSINAGTSDDNFVGQKYLIYEMDKTGNIARGSAELVSSLHSEYIYEFTSDQCVRMTHRYSSSSWICSNVVYTTTGWTWLGSGQGNLLLTSKAGTTTMYTTNSGTGYLAGPVPDFVENSQYLPTGNRTFNGADETYTPHSSYRCEFYQGGVVKHYHKTTPQVMTATGAVYTSSGWKMIVNTGGGTLHVQSNTYQAFYKCDFTAIGDEPDWITNYVMYSSGNKLHNGASLPVNYSTDYYYEVWPDQTIMRSKTDGTTMYLTNSTYDNGQYRYTKSGIGATLHIQNQNGHYWYGNAGGTVGNVVSWSNLMRIEHGGTYAGRLQLKYGTSISYNL